MFRILSKFDIGAFRFTSRHGLWLLHQLSLAFLVHRPWGDEGSPSRFCGSIGSTADIRLTAVPWALLPTPAPGETPSPIQTRGQTTLGSGFAGARSLCRCLKPIAVSFPETQTRGESTRHAHQTSSWGLITSRASVSSSVGASARGYQEIQMNNRWRVSLSAWHTLGV